MADASIATLALGCLLFVVLGLLLREFRNARLYLRERTRAERAAIAAEGAAETCRQIQETLRKDQGLHSTPALAVEARPARDEVADLVENVAEQTKFTNTLWVTMGVLAVVVLSGKPGEPVKLPFDLGEIEARYFYLVAVLLLAAQFIAFAAAHSQIARTHLLAQRLLDERVRKWRTQGSGALHPRDRFDLTVTPSLNRIGPLVQWRYHSEPEPQRIVAIPTTVLYLYLKLLALGIYYGFPVVALTFAAGRYFKQPAIWRPLGLPLASTAVVGILIGAAIALGAVLFLEFRYMKRVFKRLWPEKPAKPAIH